MIYFDYNNAQFKIGDKISYKHRVYTVNASPTGLYQIHLVCGEDPAWMSYLNIFSIDLTKQEFCDSFRISRS